MKAKQQLCDRGCLRVAKHYENGELICDRCYEVEFYREYEHRRPDCGNLCMCDPEKSGCCMCPCHESMVDQ